MVYLVLLSILLIPLNTRHLLFYNGMFSGTNIIGLYSSKYHWTNIKIYSYCREDQIKGEIQEHQHIVKVREPRGNKLGGGITGIESKVYQLRASSEFVNTRRILYREITCWCSNCVVGNFDYCLDDSKWSAADLATVEKQKSKRGIAAAAADNNSDDVIEDNQGGQSLDYEDYDRMRDRFRLKFAWKAPSDLNM